MGLKIRCIFRNALKHISVYKVGYVNLLTPYPNRCDNHYDRKTVGLYPDILYKRNTQNEVRNDGFWEPHYFEIGEKYLLSAQTIYNSLSLSGKKSDLSGHF